MVRLMKECPRTLTGELERLIEFWYQKVNKNANHRTVFGGLPEKKGSAVSHEQSPYSLTNIYNDKGLCGQTRPKMSFFLNYKMWFGIHTETNLTPIATCYDGFLMLWVFLFLTKTLVNTAS